MLIQLKKQYLMIMVILEISTTIHAVDPEAFIKVMSERHALKEEALVLSTLRLQNLFFAHQQLRIQKAIKDIEFALSIKMEVSVDQRGFFNVQETLKNPETCKEVVQFGFGPALYAKIVGYKGANQVVSRVPERQKKKGVRASLRSAYKRFSRKKSVLVEDESDKKVYQDVEIQVNLYGDDRVVGSDLYQTEETVSQARIHQLIEEEFFKTEERLERDMEMMFFGRGLSDIRAAMNHALVCKKVVRLGLGSLVYDSLFGIEKNVPEVEIAHSVSCGIQTDNEFFESECMTDDESIQAELVKLKIESRLKMSMVRASRRLAILEVKRNLNDEKICAGIVRSGLDDDQYQRLGLLMSAVQDAEV